MDLDDRRRRYADAGLVVLARDGLAGVTYRNVAAQAGMSLGAIQKAFASKEEMLRAMFTQVRAQVSISELGEPGRPTAVQWLTELSLRLLPLDDERRQRQLVSAAFADLSLDDADIAAVLRDEDSELVGSIGRLIRRAQVEGELRDDDPLQSARLWLALVQGLASNLLYAPRQESDVREDLEIGLRRILRPARQ